MRPQVWLLGFLGVIYLVSMDDKTFEKLLENYVTMDVFERSMASIQRSFESVDERFSRLENGMNTMIGMMHAYTEEAREFRTRMTTLETTDAKHDHRWGYRKQDAPLEIVI